MRTRIVFSMIALLAIAASLAISGAVMATDVTIDDGDTHKKTYDLDQFGWISWSWTVEGLDSVDFWVEDENGAKYDEEYDETWDAGIFYADDSGKYDLVWRNDGSTPITVDYTVTSYGTNPAEEAISGLIWGAIITTIIIVVVIIVVVYAVVKGGKKTPDAQQQQQQQYQQQQYQQQQYQQPQQQQYPQQPYPQQPQNPQQPPQQPPEQQYYQQQQYQQPPQQPPQQQYQQPQQPVQRKPPE